MIEEIGKHSKNKSENNKFLEDFFKDESHRFVSFKQLKFLLQDKFCLSENDILTSTTFRVLRELKIHYKKAVKAPTIKNQTETKDSRYFKVIEIFS